MGKIIPVFFSFYYLFLHETRNTKIHGNVIYAKWNVPRVTRNCGLTDKEMKITFNEYCGLNPTTYELDSEIDELKKLDKLTKHL